MSAIDTRELPRLDPVKVRREERLAAVLVLETEKRGHDGAARVHLPIRLLRQSREVHINIVERLVEHIGDGCGPVSPQRVQETLGGRADEWAAAE